jgi:hypothetical protein
MLLSGIRNIDFKLTMSRSIQLCDTAYNCGSHSGAFISSDRTVALLPFKTYGSGLMSGLRKNRRS